MSFRIKADENPVGVRGHTAAGYGQRRALGDVTNRALAPSTFGVAKPSGITRSAALAAPSDDIDMAAVPDVDAPDMRNPQCFAPYVKDIIEHYKQREGVHGPSPGYMAHQYDINEKMRAILVDWLVEVHLKFRLMPETLYLTVNLIDRFLERKMVVRKKLQLVGVTAMLIASKYEEIYSPEVRDFVYITDNAYTGKQILAMEATMLNTLKFHLTVPTPYVFLNRFLKVARADSQLKHLATYFVERTLQEYRMIRYLPSTIAAAALNMALRCLQRPTWTASLQRYSGYTQQELTECIKDIQHVLTAGASSSLQAVRRKFSSPRLSEASNIPLVMI